MWFVFPQLTALGRSTTAVKYGIESMDQAQAYLAHPVLRSRLLKCIELVLWTAPGLLDGPGLCLVTVRKNDIARSGPGHEQGLVLSDLSR